MAWSWWILPAASGHDIISPHKSCRRDAPTRTPPVTRGSMKSVPHPRNAGDLQDWWSPKRTGPQPAISPQAFGPSKLSKPNRWMLTGTIWLEEMEHSLEQNVVLPWILPWKMEDKGENLLQTFSNPGWPRWPKNDQPPTTTTPQRSGGLLHVTSRSSFNICQLDLGPQPLQAYQWDFCQRNVQMLSSKIIQTSQIDRCRSAKLNCQQDGPPRLRKMFLLRPNCATHCATHCATPSPKSTLGKSNLYSVASLLLVICFNCSMITPANSGETTLHMDIHIVCYKSLYLAS